MCRGNGVNSSEKGTLQGSVGRRARTLILRDTGEGWRDVWEYGQSLPPAELDHVVREFGVWSQGIIVEETHRAPKILQPWLKNDYVAGL